MVSQAMELGEAIADSGATNENALEEIFVPGSSPIPKIRKGAELEALADKVERQMREQGEREFGGTSSG